MVAEMEHLKVNSPDLSVTGSERCAADHHLSASSAGYRQRETLLRRIRAARGALG